MFTRIEKLIYKKDLAANRLLVGEVSQEKKSSRLVLCLFKGILIFLASYCSIVSLLDAFAIPHNKPVILAAFMFFSFCVALLYLNKIIFYSLYILMFIVFTIELARYYIYANSGFQAAINILSKEYSDYFNMMVLREAQEIVADRNLTVTVASIFLGVFIIILLNVTISGYMNVIETMVVTLPFVEICLFIHKIPPFRYMLGLLFVYSAITLLQFSRHSRMQVKSKRMHEFSRFKKKNENFYAYQADTGVFIYSFIIAGIVSLVLLLSLGSILTPPESKIAGNKIHAKTQDFVKIFVQSGFSGFLDSYASTGGLSGGKLGGVSQVRPDFETDLVATYVPSDYRTVYLKGYTGTTYLSQGWYQTTYNPEEKDAERQYDFGAKAKMKINTEDEIGYFLRPYYSSIEDLTVTNAISPYVSTNNYTSNPNLFDEYEVVYYPNPSGEYNDNIHDDLLDDEAYYKYVYEDCLQVPEDIKDSLDNALESIDDTFAYSSTNEYRLKKAEAIYDFFLEDFSYTMAPGSTPRNRDFVTNFLDNQHRGFCAHFASATVMLLRESGIPARYCEGYSIPLTLVLDSATIADANFDDYYEGEIGGAKVNYAIQVPVNDSYAHAWVEIYLDGYGFVPFEATIPSFEEETNTLALFNGFGGLFSVLMNNTPNLENTLGGQNNNTTGGVTASKIMSLFKFNTNLAGAIILRVFSALLLGVGLFFLVKLIMLRIKLAIYKKNNDEYNLVMYEYTKLVKKLRRKHFIKKANPLPTDVKEAYDAYLYWYNSNHKKEKIVDTNKLFEYYERIMYS